MKQFKTRVKYLHAALLDVEKGMDCKTFFDKYSADKWFDEDDWLMLRNFIRTSSKKSKN